MPAGRVEIQIRTALQRLWANSYESLADVCGRGIRYGLPIDQASNLDFDPSQVRAAVQRMHDLSAALATEESQWQESSTLLTSGQQLLELRANAVIEALAITTSLPTIDTNAGEDGE